jgi:hypothetical protein
MILGTGIMKIGVGKKNNLDIIIKYINIVLYEIRDRT